MPKKNIVQDVIPGKKSIRNVILPSKSPNLWRVEDNDSKINTKIDIKTLENPLTPSYKFEYDEPKKHSGKVFYVSIVLFILTLTFGLSTFWKSAKVIITPKQEVRILNSNFKASKNVSTGLGFQIVTTTKDAEKIVTANGEEQVLKKARGTIVIYNNTVQTQKLVVTTRFQTKEGLVFRSLGPVSIPPKQIVNGKSVAGNIETVVEADKAGVDHNVGLKDFTIPGFKGDPKYTLVYARSKTEMSGGFNGKQMVVSKEIMEKTDKELEDILKSGLLKDISSQIPDNFVLYNNGLFYNFQPVVQGSMQDSVVLKKKGAISAIIFDKGVLSRAIMAKITPDQTSSMIKVDNLTLLNFSLLSPTSFNPINSTTVEFNLSGNANLVWIFDQNKLKTDLLGLSKRSANSVLSSYDSIKSANVETYPFWNKNIPLDAGKVTVINTIAK